MPHGLRRKSRLAGTTCAVRRGFSECCKPLRFASGRSHDLGALQPKEGEYYVISEARLIKPLDAPGEWMIEAGSSLIKRETVLQTARTHYLGTGKILPSIVQYVGMRDFKTEDGKTIQIPVLREVSLPMKWTLGGGVPASYARYRTG